jgi:hypothetical protein
MENSKNRLFMVGTKRESIGPNDHGERGQRQSQQRGILILGYNRQGEGGQAWFGSGSRPGEGSDDD